MTRALIAWICFILGVLVIVVDIAMPPLMPTGLFFLGVVVLVIWLWLIRAFTRAFWIDDDPRLAAIDNELEERGL